MSPRGNQAPLTDQPSSWPVTGSEDLHRSAMPFAVRADQVQRPGHETQGSFTRLVLEHPGAVVILALDEENRAVCLRQYRHPVGATLVELPAGLCDVAGEAAEAVASRELREETGITAESWQHLGSLWSSPGISEEMHHYFLARDLREVGRGDFAVEHEEAEMEVFRTPVVDLRQAVLEGRVQDAPVALALLLAEARGFLPSSQRGESSR